MINPFFVVKMNVALFYFTLELSEAAAIRLLPGRRWPRVLGPSPYGLAARCCSAAMLIDIAATRPVSYRGLLIINKRRGPGHATEAVVVIFAVTQRNLLRRKNKRRRPCRRRASQVGVPRY